MFQATGMTSRQVDRNLNRRSGSARIGNTSDATRFLPERRSYRFKDTVDKGSVVVSLSGTNSVTNNICQTPGPDMMVPDTEVAKSSSSSSPKSGWKASKMFQRASNEVIKAIKSGKGNKLSANQAGPPMAIAASDQIKQKSKSDNPSAPSTSSAFSSHASSSSSSFSSARQQQSQIAVTSPTSQKVVAPAISVKGTRTARDEWKLLKSKLVSLKKKETVAQSGSQESDPCEGKSAGLKAPEERTRRSGSQDEGIICRKQDLIDLIEASKANLVKSDSSHSTSPTPSGTSCSERRRSSSTFSRKGSSDKGDARLTLQQPNITITTTVTKQQQRKGLLRRSCSEDSQTLEFDKPSGTTGNKSDPTDKLTGSDNLISPVQATSSSNEPDSKDSSSSLSPGETTNVVRRYQHDDDDVKQHGQEVNDNEDLEDEEEDEDDDVEENAAASTVKWDDTDEIDAMAIGLSIETFLKGIGSIPPPQTNEKRVSFKKNC